MFYKERRDSGLSEIVKAISEVEGVLVAIFFGSRARGDADEYSDYDILVVFENDEARRKNCDELHEKVSEIGLFTQVLTYSLREVREEIEPTFLQEVLRHGRIIFSRYPFEAPAAVGGLRPMRIVTYELKNLSHRNKQKLCYHLFGKQTQEYSYEGRVAELGGTRLGGGCILVPEENYEELSKTLTEYNVKHKAMIAYI